jgi:hypothetical protein
MDNIESRQGGVEAASETIEGRHANYVTAYLSRFNEDHPLLAGVLGLHAEMKQGDVSEPELVTYLAGKVAARGGGKS